MSQDTPRSCWCVRKCYVHFENDLAKFQIVYPSVLLLSVQLVETSACKPALSVEARNQQDPRERTDTLMECSCDELCQSINTGPRNRKQKKSKMQDVHSVTTYIHRILKHVKQYHVLLRYSMQIGGSSQEIKGSKNRIQKFRVRQGRNHEVVKEAFTVLTIIKQAEYGICRQRLFYSLRFSDTYFLIKCVFQSSVRYI